jgi:hypothetical protein
MDEIEMRELDPTQKPAGRVHGSKKGAIQMGMSYLADMLNIANIPDFLLRSEVAHCNVLPTE